MEDQKKDAQAKLDYLIEQDSFSKISDVIIDSVLSNPLGFTKSSNSLRTLICYTAGVTAHEIYLQLLSHRDRETGICNPSQTTIGKELNVDRATISRNISSLFELGFLVAKTKNNQAKTLYYYFPYEDFTTFEQFEELINYSNKSNINKIIKKPNSKITDDELFDDLDAPSLSKPKKSESNKKKKSEPSSSKKSEQDSSQNFGQENSKQISSKQTTSKQKQSVYTIYYNLYKDLYSTIPDSSWDTMDYLKSYVPAQSKLIIGLSTLKLQQTKESYESIANGPESWYNSVSLDVTTSLDTNLNLDSSSLLTELQEPFSEFPKTEYVVPEQKYFYPEIKIEDRYNINPNYKEFLINLPEYGKSIMKLEYLKKAESTIDEYQANLQNINSFDELIPFNLILYALGIDYFLFSYYTDKMYPKLVTGNLLVNNPIYKNLQHPEVIYNSTFDSLLKENGPEVIRFLNKLRELSNSYLYASEISKLDDLVLPLLEADNKLKAFKNFKASYDNKVHREEVEAKNKKTWENIAKAKSAKSNVVLFPDIDIDIEEEQPIINKEQELPIEEYTEEEEEYLAAAENEAEEIKSSVIEEDDFDFEAELFALEE